MANPPPDPPLANLVDPAIAAWENLVETANLQPVQVAKALLAANADVTWDAALAPFVALAGRSANPKAITSGIIGSVEPVYHLVVKEGGPGSTVQVIYGMKPATPLNDNNTRFCALMGERAEMHGQQVHPKLYTPGGTVNGQDAFFGPTEDMKIGSEEDFTAAFNGTPDLRFIEPMAEESEVEATKVFKALPIHPMLAALFFNGMPVRDAFFLTKRILAAIPAEHQDSAAVLMDYVRFAVTGQQMPAVGAAEAHTASVLSADWRLQDPAAFDGLELCCCGILKHCAPTWTDPTTLPARGSATGPRSVTFDTEPQRPSTGTTDASLVRALKEANTETPKPYAKHEREQLLRLAGHDPSQDHFEMLTDSNLPKFWRDLLPLRKNKNGALLRSYVEHILANTDTDDVNTMRYPTMVSTQLLKDLKDLSLKGDDPLLTWSNRHKGISVFSLAPLGENVDQSRIRAKMVHYEETIDRHNPSDRSAQQDLSESAAQSQIPSERLQCYRWIDHFVQQLTLILGPLSAALIPLTDLRRAFMDPMSFNQWKPANFQAFIWVWHRSIRHFFAHAKNSTLILDRLLRNVQSGEPIDPARLPFDTPAPPPSHPPPGAHPYPPQGAGGPHNPYPPPHHPPPGVHGEPPYKRQAGGDAGNSGAPYAKLFAAEINRARQATKPGEFRARLLVTDVRTLLGHDFCQMVPANRSPCLNYHVFGSCRLPTCQNIHQLPRIPPDPVLQGIFSRLKKLCSAYIARVKNG